MKEAVFSGRYIYQKIKSLEEEVEELGSALVELEKGTTPWNLLNRAFEDKRKEITGALNTNYSLKH